MLSVVIPARDAEGGLGGCLDSLLSQYPPPDEVIVVDDGSVDGTASLARARGVRVISLPESRGPGAARNAGAAAATGKVLGFVDSDDRVRRGWVAALTQAFDKGAVVAASTGAEIESGSLAASYPGALRRRSGALGRSSDNRFVSGSLLAIRRDVFLGMGGFDEQLYMGEDVDLSFRLAMAGHAVTHVPDAVVEYHGRETFSALLRQRMEWERWNCFLHWKYQHNPIVMARYRYGRQRLTIELASAAAQVLSGRRTEARFSLLHAAVLAARRVGEVQGWLDLLLLRRRPPDAVPLSHENLPLAALPRGPSGLIIGDRRLVRVVARGVHADGRFSAPPPGPVAAERWDDPPPWSRRLVREARSFGWRIPLELSARRIEWEKPATYGDAVLAMHGWAAWLGSKRSYALALSGPDGALLSPRFPDSPIVATGDGSKGDLEITRRQLRHDPANVAGRLSEVLGLATPDRVAAALRLASLKALV